MFFIFSYDLLLWVLLLGGFLIMLAIFPVFTVIVTVLGIWVVIAAFKEGRREGEE